MFLPCDSRSDSRSAPMQRSNVIRTQQLLRPFTKSAEARTGLVEQPTTLQQALLLGNQCIASMQ